MKKEIKFLTAEEKKNLAMQGKNVPVCIGSSVPRNSFIAKVRGTIFDGSLNHKKFYL